MRPTPFRACALALLLAGCATTERSAGPVARAERLGFPAEIPPDPPDTFPVAQVGSPPRPRRQVPPRYPADMRQHRATGEAVIDFIIDREGNVQRPLVVAATHAASADAALIAVAQWRFEPGRKNGRPVNTRMQVPIVFTLAH